MEQSHFASGVRCEVNSYTPFKDKHDAVLFHRFENNVLPPFIAAEDRVVLKPAPVLFGKQAPAWNALAYAVLHFISLLHQIFFSHGQ